MPVNNISSICYFGVTQSAPNGLSEETKRKLLALGIDPSTVKSETEAQALIATVKQKVDKVTNESTSQSTCCSSECELISKAKQLAAKIGVPTSNNDSLKNLIDKISTKLSANSNVVQTSQETDKITGYKNELNSIENEYSQINTSQNSLLSAMNISANMNKIFLKLQQTSPRS